MTANGSDDRDVLVYCEGLWDINSSHKRHRRMELALISAWEEQGERYLQDLTAFDDNPARAIARRAEQHRRQPRRQYRPGASFAFRLPSGKVVPYAAGPSAQTDAIPESDSLDWYFTCPRCPLSVSVSNQRVSRGIANAIAGDQWKLTVWDLTHYADLPC